MPPTPTLPDSVSKPWGLFSSAERHAYRGGTVETFFNEIERIRSTASLGELNRWLTEHTKWTMFMCDMKDAATHTSYVIEHISVSGVHWRGLVEIDDTGPQEGWRGTLFIAITGCISPALLDLALRTIGINPFQIVPSSFFQSYSLGVYLKAIDWRVLAAKQLLFGSDTSLESIAA